MVPRRMSLLNTVEIAGPLGLDCSWPLLRVFFGAMLNESSHVETALLWNPRLVAI